MKVIIKNSYFFLFLILMLLFSCRRNHSFISGKWNVDGTGTVDTTNAQQKLLPFGMLTILSSGYQFNFESSGQYILMNHDKKISQGKYVLSSNNKVLTITTEDNTENVFDIKDFSEVGLILIARSNESIIKLKKVK